MVTFQTPAADAVFAFRLAVTNRRGIQASAATSVTVDGSPPLATLRFPLVNTATARGPFLFEVDFSEPALEFKSSRRVRHQDFKGVRALREEHSVRRTAVVSRETRRRTTEDGVEILPWQDFCRSLWSGELV